MADAIFISSKRLILNNIHIISFFSSLLFNFSTPPQNWSVLLYEFNFVNTFSVYRSQCVAINLPPIIVKFPLNDIENILSDCHQMQTYNPNYTFCLFFLQIVTSCNSTFRFRWWFSYGFCICNANNDAWWCMEKKRSPDLLPNDPKTHRSLAGWRGRWLNTTLTRSEFSGSCHGR